MCVLILKKIVYSIIYKIIFLSPPPFSIESKQQLDSEEIEECKKIVNEYIANPDPSSKIILTDMIRIHECFYHFKHLYNDMIKKFEKANQSAGTK